jgi:GntR family transcriptional repressor for pyruvate dehydrogenase complex
MYKAIQAERLYEQVVEQIEERILSGDLHTGDQLPSERQLAEQLNVSRTVVREAVKALSQKGLVEIRTGRGTFIKDGTPEAVRHSLNLMMRFEQDAGPHWLVEVREIIEPEIAALAASRINEKRLLTLKEAIAEMDASLDRIEDYIAADLKFHSALAEATDNPLILKLVDTIVDLLQEQRAKIGVTTNGPLRAQIHHKQIFEAIERRDPESARREMRAHLQQVREDGEEALSKNP